MGGWIKLHRRLREKPIWTASNCFQKTLLVTLLLMANHQEKEWEWQKKPFRAKPGQFVTSVPSLIREIGKEATEQKIRTALERFAKYEFLTDEATKTGRLITIVNWGQYQGGNDDDNGRFNGEITDNQRTGNGHLTPNKKDKNIKNDKNKYVCSKFDEFWKLYPRKVNKQHSKIQYEKVAKNEEIEEKILKGLILQVREWEREGRESQFIPHATTWINQKRFDDDFGNNEEVQFWNESSKRIQSKPYQHTGGKGGFAKARGGIGERPSETNWGDQPATLGDKQAPDFMRKGLDNGKSAEEMLDELLGLDKDKGST